AAPKLDAGSRLLQPVHLPRAPHPARRLHPHDPGHRRDPAESATHRQEIPPLAGASTVARSDHQDTKKTEKTTLDLSAPLCTLCVFVVPIPGILANSTSN